VCWVRLNVMHLALHMLCNWNRNLLREMRYVRSMNAVRCQLVLAVTCTDGGLGPGLQKSLYPYAIYTLQFDITCSHDLINPLNAELNPICHLLALLGGATIVVVSSLRVNVVMLEPAVMNVLFKCGVVTIFKLHNCT
jgi:hypothetical protein